jgi:DNA-binding MarR family transcriptional regulator
LVDRLVAQGLVRRDIDPEDRRYVMLSLTTDGEDLSGRICAVPCRRGNPAFQSIDGPSQPAA